MSNKATLRTQAATASRGQAHRASSSHRHLVRPQTLRTGRRGLSLGPRCGQHRKTWARVPGCAVQERPGVGPVLRARDWGRGALRDGLHFRWRRPWPGGPQGERVGCVRPEQQEPLPWPQRKEKGAPIWQSVGSSNRAKREHRSWPGSALPPGQHLQHPTPFASQGMDSRGNGQRREITVEFIGCDSIRREHRQRPRHAGGGAGVGTDGERTSTSTLSSALGRPTR